MRMLRWARWLGFAFIGIAALFFVAMAVLNSDVGKRFVADQIAAQTPKSGLRIRVGRIDGSLFSTPRLRDVRFSDPSGEFLRVSEAQMDWHPFQFLLRNRLVIDELIIPRATLSRAPNLLPGDPKQPILPDFDIIIGKLDAPRIDIAQGIAGDAHVARLSGSADIRAGTAEVHADARLIDAGERVTLDLVAAPDRNEFDVDGTIVAPRGGVIATLAGFDRGISAVVRGAGSWQRWQGSLVATSGGAQAAMLRLTASDGRYGATGRLWPGAVTSGLIARLTPGGAALDVNGRFENRRWAGDASLVSSAMQLDTKGNVDLGRNRFDAFRVDAWVRRPELLLDNMAGQNVRGALLIDGGFSAPQFEYLVTAPWMSFSKARLDAIEAKGRGIVQGGRVSLPLTLKVGRITGIGALAEGIIRNLRADGTLTLADQVLTTDLLRVRSDGLDGRINLLANFRTGDRLMGFDGSLPGIEIQKLGRFDVQSALTARPAVAGGFAISGRARVTTRRLDNGFLKGLTGGLPLLDSGLALGPDGIIRFNGLRVQSPLLNVSGNGLRRADGTFHLEGAGTHRRYGPLNVILDGPIDRPQVDLLLRRPLPAAKVEDLRLRLIPSAAGFDFTGNGQSVLGPFTGTGQILLPAGGTAIIDLQPLTIGGATARGRLSIVTGGLAGRLTLVGGGINGGLDFSVPNGIQRIAADVTARDARFTGASPISIGRGRVQATLLLDPKGTDIDANFEGSGIRYGSLSLARINGTAHLVNGSGRVRASLSGARGRSFALNLAAVAAPDRFTINGAGTLAGRPIRLARPAVLQREGAGWRLSDSELSFANGRVRLSGVAGGNAVELNASLDALPLSLLDIGWPDLGLSGLASGDVQFRDAGGPPTGTARLRVRGLTRAGMNDTIQPVDVGLNAALTASSAALRAVVTRDGNVIGRLQGRVNPLASSGPLLARLRAAPLFAQLRYSGEAANLWRLTGIQSVGLSGPIAVAADVNGTLNDPQIRGIVRASGARFENYQTGTIVTNASAVGRFDGSRLQLRNISGETPGGGTLTGEGDFDLAAARGFTMDVRMTATRALLVARDDLTARVTGPVRLSGDNGGGTISGNVTLDQGSFRLGRATAAEALPVLNVREINAPADRRAPRATGAPWQLALDIRGRNRFIVTGLGLNSEWSTNLQVRGPVDRFAITGTANLVRGDYEFAGRRFELRTGMIRFTGSYPVDPVLDITAVDDVSGIDATINVRGTGLRPEISFTSSPALPEDELLSRILFGSSVTDISVTEAAQLGIALAGLRSGGDGIDPINAIRRATGLDRLRILPANTEIGAGTSIAAGKYLTRRIFVEVVTDGQGYSATRVEYQVTRWLALLASISTLGEQSASVRVHRDY